jgi:hypothetical protein
MNESVANTGEMWIVPGDDFDAAATNDKLIVGDYSSKYKKILDRWFRNNLHK